MDLDPRPHRGDEGAAGRMSKRARSAATARGVAATAGGVAAKAHIPESQPVAATTRGVAATARGKQSPETSSATMQLDLGPVQVHRGSPAVVANACGVAATAYREQLSETPPATMQLDLGQVQVCRGPATVVATAREVAATARSSVDKGTQCKFSQGRGREFAKHKAYREVNGMVTETGWAYSTFLSDQALPKMTARVEDLLHIIWLFLELRGVDPKYVNQIWNLDQSLVRGEWDKGSLYQKRPSIPGLDLSKRDGITATVLPNSRMWANRFLRFLTGAEMLQLQGVPVAQYPWLLQEKNALCKKLAGNMFAVPCVGMFCLAALVRHAHPTAALVAHTDLRLLRLRLQQLTHLVAATARSRTLWPQQLAHLVAATARSRASAGTGQLSWVHGHLLLNQLRAGKVCAHM